MGKQKTKKLLALLTAAALALSVTLIAPLTASADPATITVTGAVSISDDALGGGEVGFEEDSDPNPAYSPHAETGYELQAGDTIIVENGATLSYIERIKTATTIIVEAGGTIQTANNGTVFKVETFYTFSPNTEKTTLTLGNGGWGSGGAGLEKIVLSGNGGIGMSGNINLENVAFEVVDEGADVALHLPNNATVGSVDNRVGVGLVGGLAFSSRDVTIKQLTNSGSLKILSRNVFAEEMVNQSTGTISIYSAEVTPIGVTKLDNKGTINIMYGAELSVENLTPGNGNTGTINNLGGIGPDDQINTLTIGGTFTNSGTINVEKDGVVNVKSTLTNAADKTVAIKAGGTVNVDGTSGAFINRGEVTIAASTSSPAVEAGLLTISNLGTGSFSNEGTLTNNGEIEIDSGILLSH
ncbi:MAG: hypothetical protein FWG90_11265, partial [Oscillospiraceae bacterium]|nr:hypothetical protein [Oscillospiraceae bacterium]